MTSYHNICKLHGSAIKSVSYVANSFQISPNQAAQLPPTISQSGSVWIIDIYCSRDKSAPVATQFNTICGNENHEFTWSAGDRQPAELNFFFGLHIGLQVGDTVYPVTLYIAQGSKAGVENWWIGGPCLAYRGKGLPIIPIQIPSGMLREVFTLQTRSDGFEFGPAFKSTYTILAQPDWLSRLPDTINIAEINLPGTHDSAAIVSVVFNPYTCQNTSLTQQLNYGIRLLDIRLKVTEPQPGLFQFITCHDDKGIAGSNEFQDFESVLVECSRFLGDRKREFVAMSLKIDDWNGLSAQANAVFNALYAVLSPYKPLAQAALPTLGQARGKICLFNRLNQDLRFGPPIRVPDNTTGFLSPPVPNLRDFEFYVQDTYEGLPANDTEGVKFQLFKDCIGQTAPGRLMFNFASATFLKGYKVMINGMVLNFLGGPKSRRPAKMGWSLFDYAVTGYDSNIYGAINVVQLVIDSNFQYAQYPSQFAVSDKRRDQF